MASQDQRFYWRGKGLGGSSMMNGQIAIRGVADAFDQWLHRLVGQKGSCRCSP